MKGEIILRRFNKVCKNLKSTTIDEILNDFNKIDSFNSLDEEEKKILVDIMYKFSKLCIKSNITARIQESHILLGHYIFECIENKILKNTK